MSVTPLHPHETPHQVTFILYPWLPDMVAPSFLFKIITTMYAMFRVWFAE